MPKYTFKSQFATEFEAIPAKRGCPTILYLHGFCSDCWGRKPETVKHFCRRSGCGMFRFEYAGHGSDRENFAKADFAVWKGQMLEIIDDIIDGNIICVGSSMGGWLALLAAMERPQRVKGVIGLAAAPNFITRFAKMITPQQQRQLAGEGKFVFGTPAFTYTITQNFIDTATANLIDEETAWPVKCPLHLLQGMKDEFVDWRRAPEIADKVISEDVNVYLFKNADHRLNNDNAIRQLEKCLQDMAAKSTL